MFINGTQKVDDQKQWVFCTLTVDGDECNYINVAPANLSDQALQDYCDSKEEEWTLYILKDLYPQGDLSETAGATELEKFNNWIASGCKNPDETVIEKVPFSGNHDALYDRPLNTRKISNATRVDYKNAVTDNDRLAILEKIIFGNNGA